MLSERINVLSTIIHDEEMIRELDLATDCLVSCFQSGGKLLMAGNGGSAAQSQHFCSELMGRFKKKRSPIQALSLSSDISLVTCIANDFGYERIFSRQIEGLGNNGDVFVAFTTSGKSRNIIEALCECKARSVHTIVFSGNKTNEIRRLADFVIAIPSEDTAVIQEVQMQLIHILCEIIDDSINDSHSLWDEVISLGRQGFDCLLLDRDGVVNHVKANGYIHSPHDFTLREDFLLHASELSDVFRHIFVVSNQKGIGKGLMTMTDLESVNRKMIESIKHRNGRIDRIYYGTDATNDSPFNKPNIGMAERIKKDFPDVDFNKAVVVGDSASDYLFADNLSTQFVYARTR